MGSASSIRVLLARTSRRVRLWGGLVVALGCISRLLFVAVAYLFARGAAIDTLTLGLLAAVVFALVRAAQSFLRVAVQREVYGMTSNAVLASDVVSVPTRDMRRIALDGTFHAVEIVAHLLPAIVADALASIALVPLIVSALEARLVVLVAVAMAVITLAAIGLRALAQRLEQGSVDRYTEVIETLLGTIEGRLEIVARAGEDAARSSFERQLSQYEASTRRSGFASALLGRAPVAAGAVAVVLVVAIDTSARTALEAALLSKSLFLAACLPALYGAALGFHGLVRATIFVRPLVELLAAAAASRQTGGELVSLPTTIRGDRISFAYSPELSPTLEDVSFAWTERQPLVLTGPNGSGKSTLLKLVLGLRAPTSGTLTFGDVDSAKVSMETFRRSVAYLPQRPYLGEAHATVRSALASVRPDVEPAELRAALERTGVLAALGEHGKEELETPLGELSAGQRQRVALARLLLRDVRVVLLDEPDANMDAAGLRMVAELVAELCARGVMVAVAAHSPELATLAVATHLELPARRHR